jgi:predicted metal-dependent phosphoesterase TrpH
MPADFHTHSYFSDGYFSPSELIKNARDNKLTSIALTDHDNIDGITEAKKAAEELGIKFIVGIEITTSFKSFEIHILGYNFDYKSTKLEEALAPLKKGRLERIYKIAKKLEEQNIFIGAEKIFEFVGRGVAGRPHVAQALTKAGYVASPREAFEKFLKQGGSCYVDHEKMETISAINLILETGGVPVLAHPGTSVDNDTLMYFIKSGLKGIEAYYPRHKNSQIEHYLEVAKQFSLLVTGGSDFHGQNALYPIDLGNFYLPDEFEKEFLTFCNGNQSISGTE